MGTRTSYAPGTPSWIDLSTPDTGAARAFYGAVFGWSFDEQPTGDQGTYIMCAKDGETVAGMMTLSDEMAASGMPPVWSSYVTVTDIEATVAKVVDAGGAVMQEPFDVMTAGRMAIIADPAGAVICLWQAKEHIGATLVNVPGTLCWNELISTDLDASIAFYEAVLGWTAETADMGGGMHYTSFATDGTVVAGGMRPPAEGMGSFWGIYFAVDDCDAAAEAITANGGTIMQPPMDIPVGRMALAADPTGAMFSIIRMNEPAD